MLTALSSANTGIQRRTPETKPSEPMQTKTPPAPGPTDGGEDSPVVRTHHSRQRLRPWLENLVNEGLVKGLEWIDKEKKLFKIPWKHAGKQDYNQEEDSKIFKLWSLNTGKYKPGIHVPEPAVWKTRLRTALNKLPDIDEVHEKTQLDIPEPYRVYRLLPKKPSNSSMRNRVPNSQSYGQTDHSRGVASVGGYSAPYNNPYMVDQRTSYYSQYPTINGSDRHGLGQTNYHQQASSWYDPGRTASVDPGYGYTGYNCYNTSSSSTTDLDIISDVITEDIGGNHGHHPSGHAHYPPSSGHVYEQEGALAMEQGRHSKLDSASVADTLTNNNDPRHVNYHDLVPMTTVTSSGFTTCTATTKTNPPPSYGSSLTGNQPFSGATTCAITMATESGAMDTTDVPNHHPQQQQQQQHDYSSNPKRMRSCKEPSLPAEHVMAIQISYQSADAGYRCVDNPNGCVLYFNQPWEEGIQRGMEAFNLPDICAVPPHPEMTEKQIRQTAEVLGCFEKGMSIECRHGNIYVTRRCRSVVFWCAPNANETPTKLERDVEVKVFDLAHFHDQLRRCYLGEDVAPILPEIYFTVAQKLISHDMPLHACLISIVVTPLRASEELRAISPEVHSLHQSIRSGLLQLSGPSPDCSSPLGNSWSDLSQFRRMSAMV